VGLRDEGFAGQKWFFGDGPADGAEGLANNVALARTVREAVGDEPDIMFDALGGFDLTHAWAWAQRVEELTPRWLEEPFPPNRLPAFAELRAATSVPLATGEHLYDRADVLPYLSEGILAAVQADPEWCGGVTELVRICALAETFGVPVIPHGHGLHSALHVIAAQSPVVCPMAEYLVRIMPNRHHFELDPPTPVGGSFELPTEPGFGITLDESKIDSRTVLQFN
jgi:L-alanine-DL-glutamate epimerase-like enolase superfamily enzyme